MGVVSILSKDIQMQLHVPTHSPLVMASAEAVFDDRRDALNLSPLSIPKLEIS